MSDISDGRDTNFIYILLSSECQERNNEECHTHYLLLLLIILLFVCSFVRLSQRVLMAAWAYHGKHSGHTDLIGAQVSTTTSDLDEVDLSNKHGMILKIQQ